MIARYVFLLSTMSFTMLFAENTFRTTDIAYCKTFVGDYVILLPTQLTDMLSG